MSVIDSTRRAVAKGLDAIADAVRPPSKSEDYDRELNQRIDAMVSAGRSFAEAWADIDRDGPRMLYGDQTAGLVVKEGWLPVQDNQLRALVDQSQAMLSMRRPTIRATALQPEDPQEKEGATLAGQAINWQFHKGLNVPLRLIEAQPDLHGYGWCVAATYWEPKHEWDEDAKQWRGAVEQELVDPRCFFADGQAQRAERCQYTFTLTRIPVERALQRWPKSKEAILAAARKEATQNNEAADGEYQVYQQAGSTSAATLTAERKEHIGTFGTNGRLLDALNRTAGDNPAYGPGENPTEHPAYVTVMEMIFADYEEEKVPAEVELGEDELIASNRLVIDGQGFRMNPATGKPYIPALQAGQSVNQGDPDRWPAMDASYTRPKYPYGRHIVRFGEDAVVVDEPWRYKRSLWTIGLFGVLPHTWRGKNAVEAMKCAQDEWNVLMMYVTNWVRNQCDGGWIVEENTFTDDPTNKNIGEKMKSRPGWCVSVAPNKAGGIQQKPTPILSPSLPDLLDRCKAKMQDIAGIHDARMGQAVGDSTLGEVQIAETNDRVRAGVSGLLLDMFTIELMETVWEICRAHWQPGDLVRVLGEQASSTVEVDAIMLDAEFELSLEVTTQLPYDRERNKAAALEIFDRFAELGMGDLALKWLLKVFETPDAEELLKAVEQRMNELATQKQAADEAAAVAAQEESQRKGAETQAKVAKTQAAPGVPAEPSVPKLPQV